LFYLLNYNINLNDFTNVVTENIAFSDKLEEIEMDITNLPSASSIIPDIWNNGAEYLYKDSIKQKVSTYTWDYFVEIYGLKIINLLKTDPEGAELLILKGMTKVLPERIIISIYHQPAPFVEIHKVLHNKGYILDGMGYYDKNAKNKGKPHSAFFRRKDIAYETPQVYTMQEWEKPDKRTLKEILPYYPKI
jgi:FkbM family methyltransferase